MELQHVLKLQEEGNMKSLLKPNQSTNPKEKKQIVSGVWEGLRQNVTWANYLRAKRPPNSFQRPRPYWSGARRSARPHPGQTSGDIKPRFTVEDNRRILAAETTLHAPAVSPSAWACHLHPPSRWYNVPHQKQPCRFLMFSVRKTDQTIPEHLSLLIFNHPPLEAYHWLCLSYEDVLGSQPPALVGLCHINFVSTKIWYKE